MSRTKTERLYFEKDYPNFDDILLKHRNNKTDPQKIEV